MQLAKRHATLSFPTAPLQRTEDQSSGGVPCLVCNGPIAPNTFLEWPAGPQMLAAHCQVCNCQIFVPTGYWAQFSQPDRVTLP